MTLLDGVDEREPARELDLMLSFKNPLLKERYEENRRTKRLDRYKLYPFFAFVVLVAPFCTNSQAALGRFGWGYQIWTCFSCTQPLGSLLVILLDRVSRKSLCGFLRCTVKQCDAFEQGLWTYMVCINPIVNGSLTLLRALSSPCAADVNIFDASFCNPTAPGQLATDCVAFQLGFPLFYSVLYPVRWRTHLLAWGFSCSLLVITAALTATAKTSVHHAEIIFINLLVLALLYSLQRKSMVLFMLKERGESQLQALKLLSSVGGVVPTGGGGGGGSVAGAFEARHHHSYYTVSGQQGETSSSSSSSGGGERKFDDDDDKTYDDTLSREDAVPVIVPGMPSRRSPVSQDPTSRPTGTLTGSGEAAKGSGAATPHPDLICARRGDSCVSALTEESSFRLFGAIQA